MLSLVVDKCSELLAAQPAPVLPAASIGSRQPSTGAEIPAIAISLTVDEPKGIGFGRFIREGDALTQNPAAGDVRGDRYRGALALEVWGNNAAQVDDVARRLQQRLEGPAELLRAMSFKLLRPASLDPAENVLYQPPTGAAFPVWKQRLSYRFVFEYEEAVAPSGGGPIKRIDVDVTQPPETFAVP